MKRVMMVFLALVWGLLFLAVAHFLMRHGPLGPLGSPQALLGLATLALLGFLLCIGVAACATLCNALWPHSVDRCDAALREFPLRCWLVGILIVLLQILIVAPNPVLLAVALPIDLFLLARGFPALAARIGEGLGESVRPRAVARGMALFTVAAGVPVLGWLLGLGLLLQALGAAVVPPSRVTAG